MTSPLHYLDVKLSVEKIKNKEKTFQQQKHGDAQFIITKLIIK